MKSIEFADGMNSIFSELEEDILKNLWANGSGHSKSLHEDLGKKYKVPHTTIAVTLNRLHEKGILIRKPQKTRGGTRYIYTPKLSREDLGTHLGQKFFSFLRKNFGETCVANLKKKI